jgi:DNA-binding PadR family transcriptional regulator
VRTRSNVLDTAILGLLSKAPLHGYELRKQLAELLGPFRAFSYGTLYPALRALQDRSLIVAADPASVDGAKSRRGKIVYELSDTGVEHLRDVLALSGPASWEDESFDVRFALFAQTDVETRLRILEGRRSRLTERLETVRQTANRTRGNADEYTLELQRHGLDRAEREVRWLDDLITQERGRAIRGPQPTK